MKYAERLLLMVIISVCLGLVPTASRALDAVPTDDDYWLQDTAVKISAYARTANGSNVRYLELFNDSDVLVDVATWKITAVSSTGVRSELSMQPVTTGLFAPKTHVVVKLVEEVNNASFASTGWTPVLTGGVLTSLEVTARASGWKTDVYTLKTSGSGATIKYDEFWVRTQTSDGYTSTLSSFSAATPIALHDDGLYELPSSFPGEVLEIYPFSSECAPNDNSVLCGDYIKIRLNSVDADISSFVLRTSSSSSSRTTSNTFYLSNPVYSLNDDGYLTVAQGEDGKRISLTNSGGYIWIEDLYGGKIYDETMTQYQSAGDDEQGYTWARAENSATWQWSTTPQPFGANIVTAPVEETVVCSTGKYLNPDTGRCRTLEEAVNALASCPEGQYRNPTTNRCKQLVTTATATLAACGEGQERNPATNRCRSIASAVAELMPCDEGYERNPATNRCRKVAGVSTAAATSGEVVEMAKGSTWNIWTWSLVAVAATGAIGYGVYEWRHELLGFGQAISAKFGKK